MARPAGRYFASVIAKIRDVRKKEQIVIDESFKMQLRQKIMLKVTAQTQPQTSNWLERFAPYKSYLAVVPALGLVIVAVVGISKLPIQFTSNVVVPTSTPTQENNSQAQNVTAPQASVVEQPSSTDSSGLMTFPGRLALPSSYFEQNAPANSVAAQAPAPQQDLSANVMAPLQVNAPETSAPPATSQPQSSSNTANIANPSGNDQQQTAPQTTVQPPVSQQPQVQYFALNTQSDNNTQVAQGNVGAASTSSPVQSLRDCNG